MGDAPPSLWREIRAGKVSGLTGVGVSAAGAFVLVGFTVLMVLVARDRRLQDDDVALVVVTALPLLLAWILFINRARLATHFSIAVLGTIIVIFAVMAFGTMVHEFRYERDDELTLVAIFFGLGILSMLWVWEFRNLSRGTPVIDERTRKANVSCPDCGYSMVGLRESRCPECGYESTIDELIIRQGYAVRDRADELE